MLEEQKGGVPMRHYFLGFFVVLGMTLVVTIPSSMVYSVRVFSWAGLPEGMVEFIRIVVMIATPFAVMMTGFVRLFAVSDKHHAEMMVWAATLEGIACVLEVVSAMLKGDEFLVQLLQVTSVALSIALVFAALVITIVGSGFYKLTIAHNERAVMFGKRFNQMLLEALSSEQSKQTIQTAVDQWITTAATHEMVGTNGKDPTSKNS